MPKDPLPKAIDAGFALECIARQHLDELQTALWIFDIDDSRVVWANKSALEIWNADSPEQLARRDMSIDMSITVAQRLKQYQQGFISTGSSYNEVWTLFPGGIPTTLDVVFKGFRFEDGGMGMLCEAKAQRLDTPEGLRSSEALLHTPVMISLYDGEGTALYSNPAARAAIIDDSDRLESRFVNGSDYQKLLSAIQKHGECSQSSRMRTNSGIKWHEITARECSDAVTGRGAILLSETDITELKETEQRARYLANHDTLTGLPNRNYIQSKLPGKLKTAKSRGEKLAFLVIDLDRFKTINDTMGHAAGDELLVQVSDKLSSITGDAGFVARLGGDEFLICLRDIQQRVELEDFCNDLVEQFQSSFGVEGRNIHSTLSIGVSMFPDDGEDLHELLKFADVALYEAKDDGRNTHCLFNTALRTKIDTQLTLERDLRNALETEQFELFYQPRVDIFTNEILGAEALIRWNHPSRGILTPVHFIEAAEEIGIIHEIGEWVMTKAATEQQKLEECGHPISISINLSPMQFNSSSLFRDVLSLQERTGCNSEKIELEITETALMARDTDVTDVLAKFKDMGFGIAIDDFGRGYSNLAYIQDYPITSLKIDRSFISNIGKNNAVTKLIISLCKLLGIKAVAEGVETDGQLQWLQRNGCGEFQGFLFSPAVNRNNFWQMLEAQDLSQAQCLTSERIRALQSTH